MAHTGYLIVNMHYRVPVNVGHYNSACNKETHEITAKDIVGVEVGNFEANPDNYQEMLAEHLDSLTVDFEESHE
jgi:hypothetical protein